MAAAEEADASASSQGTLTCIDMYDRDISTVIRA